MFSSLRNPMAFLPASERLYFSNYEYYNDYEELQAYYKDDLSKIIFNCKRKSPALIALYDAKSSRYTETVERFVQLGSKSHPSIKTMEDLNDKFVQIYHQSNYSDLKNDRGDAKESFTISIFTFLQPFLQQQDGQGGQYKQQQIRRTMQQFLDQFKASCDETMTKINQLQGVKQGAYLLRWYSIQSEAKQMIVQKMGKVDLEVLKSREMAEFEHYYEYFSYILHETLHARCWSVLLFAQPLTLHLNRLFHPLTLSMYHFIKMEDVFKNEEAAPRVVFLNLDGKQSPYNIRAARKMGPHTMYVSVYGEPIADEHYWKNFQNVSQDFQEQYPTLSNFNEVYSKMIEKEGQAKEQAELNESKILLYPLNSLYLKQKHVRLHQRTSACPNPPPFPNLSSSADILFLFQVQIFEHLRQFRPDVILLSYNGSLNIQEQHFSQIMKHLTIIADHKIVLYTNMSGLFQEHEEEGMQEPQMSQQMNQEEPQECISQQNVQIVKQFYKKYMPYRYDEINEERYLTNLAFFLKISSGVYSLKSHYFPASISKYSMHYRYMYLERLAELRSCEKIATLGKWKSKEIQSIYQKYTDMEIKENRKENQGYSIRIDDVINEFLRCLESNGENMSDFGISQPVYYRLMQVRQDQKKQYMLMNGIKDEEIEHINSESTLIEYLKERKKMLLLQNLDNYHIKKTFYYDESQQRTIKMKCFKFYLGEDESEELNFQKYAQIIIDYKNSRIIIVNYKFSEDRHGILEGEISYTQKNYFLKVHEVDEALQGRMESLDLKQCGDVVYVNYSHCFLKNKVILYWPQRWSIKDEIRHKLLGIDYHPQIVHEMLNVYYDKGDRKYKYERIRYAGDANIVPKFGCSSWETSINSFYVFGGVYHSTLDFYDIGSGISIFQISDKDKTFKVANLQKKKEKISKNADKYTDKNTTFTYNTILKPKIHYRIQRSSKIDDSSLIISGGYGREFTNFYNIFSHQSYIFNIESQKLTKFDPERKVRRVIKMDRPLQINDPGKYFVIANNQNVTQVQEKFTDGPKDFFIFQSKAQKNNQAQKDIISFIDNDYRSNDYRSGRKKLYLFGYDRTIRQKIYTKFWSPELFVVDGLKLHIIYITLKTMKTSLYNISNFLTPREQDLASVCLQEDRLLVLSNSSIINSTESNTEMYVLYQGNLSNMAQIIQRKQVAMGQIYEFKNQREKVMKGKSIAVIDDKVLIIGGESQAKQMQEGIYVREDYVLENIKNKYKLKIRKLESFCKLDLLFPVIIRQNQHYLMYSIILEERPTENDFMDVWKIKIQSLTPNENSGEEYCLVGPMSIFTYDFQNRSAVLRKTVLEDPKFVKIVPYQRFDINKFKEFIQKILIRLNKLSTPPEQIAMYLVAFKYIDQERNEEGLITFLLEKGFLFKEVLAILQAMQTKPDQEIQSNFQMDELLQDVRRCYCMISKLMMEQMMCREKEGEEYKFIVEDKKSKKVKYIAIGCLKTTKLAFFRIRFKHEFSICLNKSADEDLFFHPNILSCDQIQLNDKVKLPLLDNLTLEAEISAKISVTLKL